MASTSRLILAAAYYFLISSNHAGAEVIVEDQAQSKLAQSTRVYEWHDDTSAPRGVAVAIHGLTMHGGTYDALARKLAARGFIVYAPDLRGYGQWLQRKSGRDLKPNYRKSYQDLLSLLAEIRKLHPDLPVYCVGESLGAGLAMRAASEHPHLVDGLILSSPALKHRYFIRSVIAEAPAVLAKPAKSINLAPYIKRFYSEDPIVAEATVSDPLVRKKLTTWELISACNFMRPNLKYAKKIPAGMPVLVMQGDQDQMLRTSILNKQTKRFQSKDRTVQWFHTRGHLLLETCMLQADTVRTVTNWLDQHSAGPQPELKIAESANQTIIP